MKEQIKDIISLFHMEQVDTYELQTIRQEVSDSRWILYISCGEEKYVMKLAANGFTTQERVNGWPLIIEEYRKMGYYSPVLRKSVHGHFAEEAVFQGKVCVVWEEEFAKYPLCTSLPKEIYMGKDGKYVFHDEVLAFVAKVGEKHFTNFPYSSGWCRLKPFGCDEETDEVTECVQEFDALVREKAPEFVHRWERILRLYEQNKEQLASIYEKLPTSVFQADAFTSNLLLDEKGHFKGVIDYNLAGEEVVINIFLSMILFGYSYHRRCTQSPEGLPKLNKTFQDAVIVVMLETLQYLKKYYSFSELEVEAAPLLYKYISCIEYTQLEALERYAGDTAKLQLLFDNMEQELLREDIYFRGAMLD